MQGSALFLMQFDVKHQAETGQSAHSLRCFRVRTAAMHAPAPALSSQMPPPFSQSSTPIRSSNTPLPCRETRAQTRKPPVCEITQRHAAVQRGKGDEVEQAEQRTCTRKAVRPKRMRGKCQKKSRQRPRKAHSGPRVPSAGRAACMTAPQAVSVRRRSRPPESASTAACPASCTSAANRKTGSRPSSSTHHSAASMTQKPSRTRILHALTARSGSPPGRAPPRPSTAPDAGEVRSRFPSVRHGRFRRRA